MKSLPIDDDVTPALKYKTQEIKDYFELSNDNRTAIAIDQIRVFVEGDDGAMPKFFDENTRVIVGPFDESPLNAAVANGQKEIQPFFKSLFSEDGAFPKGTELTIDGADQHNKVVYLTWHTSNGLKGSDTFVIENGKIVTLTAFVAGN